ncbi:MAG: SurA N-terminal domain-containing protein [Bdellovibrionales bacterium]|nr:SurA N-terminal domain-containing protein [Bdellovibrionales bacterium]
MIGVMRTKFGPVIIGSIIAVITAVFVFYGIFTPGSGSSATSVAGEVNGETISYAEFSRALNQRIEFFKSLMGGKIDEEQLEQFHVREAVFQDLTQRKILGQIARREGFYPSKEAVRDQILKMDVFKKDGQFDKVLYKNVLIQNQYSPTRFEEMVGQDIMDQSFRNFLGSLASVTPDEVDRELKSSKERRKVRYVYLDNESARKMLPSAKKDVKAQTPAEIAEQGKRLDKLVEDLTKDLTAAVSANNEAKVTSLLKASGVKMKTTDWMATNAEFIPGVGSIKSVSGELMSQKKGAPAKRFGLMGGTLFAMVADTESFDAAKVTPKERSEVTARLQNAKQSEMTSEFIKSWMKKASISRNDRVVVGGQGQHIPVTPDN